MYAYIKRKQRNYTSNSNKFAMYNSDLRDGTNTNDIHFTETKNGYHLEMEIMGYIKDDFNCYIKSKDLVLTTAKKQESSSNTLVEGGITKHNYCYPSAFFEKTFRLPNDVEKNQILIDYKNHILSIDLLKLNTNSKL